MIRIKIVNVPAGGAIEFPGKVDYLEFEGGAMQDAKAEIAVQEWAKGHPDRLVVSWEKETIRDKK